MNDRRDAGICDCAATTYVGAMRIICAIYKKLKNTHIWSLHINRVFIVFIGIIDEFLSNFEAFKRRVGIIIFCVTHSKNIQFCQAISRIAHF